MLLTTKNSLLRALLLFGIVFHCTLSLPCFLFARDPAIEGKWKCIRMEKDGVTLWPKRSARKTKGLNIQKDYPLPLLSIRSDRDPKEIDITDLFSGSTRYAIYRLENDQLQLLSSEDPADRPKDFDTIKANYTYSVFEGDVGEALDADAEKLLGEWTIERARNAVLPDMRRVSLKRVTDRNRIEGTIFGRATRNEPEVRKVATLVLTLDSTVVPQRISGSIHKISPPPSDRLRRRRQQGQRVAGDEKAVESLLLDGHYVIKDQMFYIQVQYAAGLISPRALPNAPFWQFVLKHK